jgi:HlyD family secretion protein
MNPKTGASVDPSTRAPRAAVIVVALSIAVILLLSLWYLVRPQPLLVQGEADAARIDIAARVDGRVAERPIHRGENVKAGQVLLTIDNPELLARLKEAEAARAVAAADFKRIEVGTRAEVVDSRRAALEAAQASTKLAEQSWDRTRSSRRGISPPWRSWTRRRQTLMWRAAASSRPSSRWKRPSTDTPPRNAAWRRRLS